MSKRGLRPFALALALLATAFVPAPPAAAQATADGAAQPAEDAAAILTAGQAAFDRRDYAGAVALWERALAILEKTNDPRTASAYFAVTLAYKNLQNYPKALEAVQRALALHRAGGDRAWEATDLGTLGIIERHLGRYADALASEQQALTLHRELKDRLAEADDLANAGIVDQDLGRYADALDLLGQALLVYRELANRNGEAGTLENIGVVEEDLGRHEDALASDRRALAMYRQLSNRRGEAEELANIASIEHIVGHDDDALALFAQALAIDRETENRLAEANALGNIGIIDADTGRYDDALSAHRQALEIHRTIGDRVGESADLGNIGNVFEKLGRYQDALDAQQRALAIDREIESARGEAADLLNLGNVEESLGRFEEALASDREAARIDHAIGNRLGESRALNDMGGVQQTLGQYADALASERQALMLERAVENPFGEAATLKAIGIIEESVGHYDDALLSVQQALSLDRSIHNRLGEAGDLGTIGNIQSDLGLDAAALNSDNQALSIDRALGNRRGEADELANIAAVDLHSGNASEALTVVGEALTLHRTLASRAGEASDLANLGIIERDLHRPGDGVDSLRQALAIDRELGRVAGEAIVTLNLGVADVDLGRYAEALAAAHDALALDARLADPVGIWHAQRLAADANARLGRSTDALAAYEAALGAIEGLRAGLNDGERGAFLEKTLVVYDQYIAYLLDLNRSAPGRGYDRKALEILERKRARAMLEEIGRSAAQHFRGVPAAVVADENAAAASLAAGHAVLSKVLSAPAADPTAVAAAERNLAAAKARIEALDASIAADYPAYAQLRNPRPVALETFQQAVLKPGELALIYDVTDGRSALWAVDRDHVRFTDLPAGDIGKAVARLGAHVAGMVNQLGPGARPARIEREAEADIPAFASDGYALFKLLVPDSVAPLVARAKSLIVVPSGALYDLAFETLVDADPAETPQPHYLIEDVPISYVPSASLLAVVRTSYAHPNEGRSPLLAFANPTFGAPSPDAARGAPALAALRAANLGAADFASLPGTQVEAEAVVRALGAPQDSLVSGNAATRERVLALNSSDRLKSYRYLLFATHAVLPSEIQGLTQPAIVLAHPERGDGLLTMADVFGLGLDADFVTLSACNTGVATGAGAGEGVSGLTRAFLYAGAPAISVTLWEVDDAAAPHITPAFFAGMERDALTPAEALRRAKIALLHAPEARFRHPYAWAPSVIFGDGDSVR